MGRTDANGPSAHGETPLLGCPSLGGGGQPGEPTGCPSPGPAEGWWLWGDGRRVLSFPVGMEQEAAQGGQWGGHGDEGWGDPKEAVASPSRALPGEDMVGGGGGGGGGHIWVGSSGEGRTGTAGWRPSTGVVPTPGPCMLLKLCRCCHFEFGTQTLLP